jgi:hypothetical protein
MQDQERWTGLPRIELSRKTRLSNWAGWSAIYHFTDIGDSVAGSCRGPASLPWQFRLRHSGLDGGSHFPPYSSVPQVFGRSIYPLFEALGAAFKSRGPHHICHKIYCSNTRANSCRRY